MGLLDYVQDCIERARDNRKRKRALRMDVGDLVLAKKGSENIFLTPGEKYTVRGVSSYSKVNGTCNLELKDVFFKINDDNGLLKEVPYWLFRY